LLHSCWPLDVKHAEDKVMCTPNLQMAVDMSMQQSCYIFLRCYLRSGNAFSGNVIFRKQICSEVVDLINL